MTSIDILTRLKTSPGRFAFWWADETCGLINPGIPRHRWVGILGFAVHHLSPRSVTPRLKSWASSVHLCEIFEQSPNILVDGRFQPATFLLPEGQGGSRRVLGRPIDFGCRLSAVDT